MSSPASAPRVGPKATEARPHLYPCTKRGALPYSVEPRDTPRRLPSRERTRPMAAPSDSTVVPMQEMSERARNPRVLRLHADDNLIVSIDPILPGAVAEGVTAVSRVPKGHKMATVAIAEGEPVRKFGQIIGFATAPIRPGEHIHTHNCGVHDFERDYAFAEAAKQDERSCRRPSGDLRGLPARERPGRHAQLHRRPDQRELLGLRRPLHRRSGQRARALLDEYPNVDGVVALHPRHRLRHGRPAARASPPCSAPNGAMPRNPNFGGVAAGRPRLRGDADPRPDARPRHRGGRDLPHHDDPGRPAAPARPSSAASP